MAQAGSVRVQLPDGNTAPESAKCDATSTAPPATRCNAHFGKAVDIGTTWQLTTVYFGDTQQVEVGAGGPRLSTEALYRIEFLSAPASTTDLWLDDLSFIDECP